MKTILITGGKSFLAKELVEYFDSKYNLLTTDRNTLDVSNKESVNLFFDNNQVDYVFHTAISGGSRLRQDSFDDLVNNLVMFQNLANKSDKYDLLFNFGSGAEFDRESDITRTSENVIFGCSPKDYYGHSKNLIAREIQNKENIVNVRLFGCFGKYEINTRFIKSTIYKCLNDEDIFVDNKEMDFISTKDLFILIEKYLQDGVVYKDINAVYDQKVNLLYIAEYIKSLTGSKSSIILNKNNTRNYSGDSTKISSLDLNFIGLEDSIKEMYDAIRKRP